jgi:ribonucleoside-diphosphate reductase beta chain
MLTPTAKYPQLYQCYKRQIAQFWTVEEIDFSGDVKQYEFASPQIKRLVQHVLAFFAVADAIVMQNISDNFLDAVEAPEAKAFYAAQMFSESVHAETYNKTILALVPNRKEQESLLTAVPKFKSVKAKKAFAERWMGSDRPFCENLIAFAFVEGLLFSASFASIYWLKTLNLFSGLTHSNELIARDENLHCEFACKLHGMLESKCSQDTIHKIVKDAVDCEHVFCDESIQELEGLDAEDMKCYVEFLADTLLVQLGVSKLYKTAVPSTLRFMDMIAVDNKTNFFEGRPSEYQIFKPTDANLWTNTLEDF